ncbi:MAG: crossover junction endodeoxyribonuclease RuvC [Chitinophagales bacterium]|nr:crossover junction endodeoxyribonuclease RuvC [Chitinophagales bacterium]
MKKTILGIDPGTNVLGFAIILVEGNKMKLLEMDVLRMKKSGTHHDKLKEIFWGIDSIINKHKPDEMAIEAPFFGKNVQSMLKLGRAQGVAISVALSHNILVSEYSPRKIKQSITGNGNSAKEQVAAILSQLLQFEHKHLLLDATDALGVAVCHHFQFQIPTALAKNKISGWKKFVALNPERVK